MSATITVQSPRNPRHLQRVTTPRRSCQVNIDLFDPFEFRGGVLCEDETRRARTAIAACQSCPLMTQCRAETAAVLDGTASRGVPPVGVVQAGILFDENSKPYGHSPAPVTTKKKASKSKSETKPTAAEQGMLDFADDLSDVIPAVNGRAVEWVPNIDLTPPRLNMRAIYLALGPQSLESTVTRHRLKQEHRPFDPGILEVLEYHDELEAVRLGVERGMPLHRIAANLRTTWHRAHRMCKILGITPPHQE
ncbi:MAG: hypothetical protein DI630_13485 [Gordonia sp. (in: high G+C Gram-positive bacteria)]|nr:MAG: hypothetical protein DI630_13485 [Gordonia sp. (in: high G+C Gram-positive bacteria)]